MRMLIEQRPEAYLSHDTTLLLLKAFLANAEVKLVLDADDREDIRAGRELTFSIDWGGDGQE